MQGLSTIARGGHRRELHAECGVLARREHCEQTLSRAEQTHDPSCEDERIFRRRCVALPIKPFFGFRRQLCQAFANLGRTSSSDGTFFAEVCDGRADRELSIALWSGLEDPQVVWRFRPIS
jgi:hypothetical protein